MDDDLCFASAWLDGPENQAWNEDWIKDNGRPLAVGGARLKKSRLSGNGLFATRDCTNGDLCFAERPAGCVPGCESTLLCCDHCIANLTTATKYRKCAYCGVAYCSQTCYSDAHRLYHKKLCSGRSKTVKAFIEHAHEASNEFFLLAARLLAAYPIRPLLNTFKNACYWSTLCLPEYLEPEDDSIFRAAVKNHIQTSFNLLLPCLEDKSSLRTYDFDEYSRLCGMLRQNAASFRDGIAFYPFHSAINHSDHPNVRVVYDDSRWPGAHIIVLASTHIEFGAELLVDYFGHDGISQLERTVSLQGQYGISPSSLLLFDW